VELARTTVREMRAIDHADHVEHHTYVENKCASNSHVTAGAHSACASVRPCTLCLRPLETGWRSVDRGDEEKAERMSCHVLIDVADDKGSGCFGSHFISACGSVIAYRGCD
jgi:hypothetical protein